MRGSKVQAEWICGSRESEEEGESGQWTGDEEGWMLEKKGRTGPRREMRVKNKVDREALAGRNGG